jgi:hypothetical protein
MSDLKIGDKVFHKSNSSIVWIIERINDNEVYCSTIIKETFEQKNETFNITSIDKCADPKIYIGKRARDNHW